ncbi:MAG: hypothetical protein QXO33_04770 [Nitrososphaeria archaeon]
MTREKLKIAGIAKTVLTNSDGRIKEIMFLGNNATAQVKIHTIQKILQDTGLTKVNSIHLYSATGALAGNEVFRFSAASVTSGTVGGSTATGVVSGQATMTANITVLAIALHTNSTAAADGSAGYALVTASIALSQNDVFGVTWCLTVQ